MFFGLCLALFGSLFALALGSIPVGLMFGGCGLLWAWLSLISFRQLRKSGKTQPSFDQFQTSTAATYSAPRDLAPATPANNETVDIWLGPILRVGKAAWGDIELSKAIVRQAENTLLFMPTQAIAIMLSPADAATESQGVFGGAASGLIEYSPQIATTD